MPLCATPIGSLRALCWRQRAAASTSLNFVMSGRFRFGVVATPQTTVGNITGNWQRQARRAEELRYSPRLMPGGMHRPAPLPTLPLPAAPPPALPVRTLLHDPPLPAA